jgi:uncharacterized membrane protein (GlpM family)
MRLLIKIVITLCVVLFCTEVGRKLPSLAGLIAVMPLTGLVVLVLLYLENPGNSGLVTEYCKGALWGIVPSILFFFVALLCFQKRLSLPLVLCASFAVWFVAAFVHQWLLSK